MAERAVYADALKPDRLLGKAGWYVVARIVEQSERVVATWPGQVLGEHARQHNPYPVRNSSGLLCSNGAVLEVGIHGIKTLVHFAEKFVPADSADDCAEQQQRKQDTNPLVPSLPYLLSSAVHLLFPFQSDLSVLRDVMPVRGSRRPLFRRAS